MKGFFAAYLNIFMHNQINPGRFRRENLPEFSRFIALVQFERMISTFGYFLRAASAIGLAHFRKPFVAHGRQCTRGRTFSDVGLIYAEIRFFTIVSLEDLALCFAGPCVALTAVATLLYLAFHSG
jgi:hypothetical protein